MQKIVFMSVALLLALSNYAMEDNMEDKMDEEPKCWQSLLSQEVIEAVVDDGKIDSENLKIWREQYLKLMQNKDMSSDKIKAFFMPLARYIYEDYTQRMPLVDEPGGTNLSQDYTLKFYKFNNDKQHKELYQSELINFSDEKLLL